MYRGMYTAFKILAALGLVVFSGIAVAVLSALFFGH